MDESKDGIVIEPNIAWSYEQVRATVVDALEVQGRPYVLLDVSQATPENVRDVVAWIGAMGYETKTDNPSGLLPVTRKADHGWIPAPRCE